MAVRRRPLVALDAGTIPATLAAGPCIDDWAEPHAKRPHLSALRRWQDACREHAEQVGGDWRAIARQARMLTPWSRDYLRAEGRDDLADYYDGLRADHPDA